MGPGHGQWLLTDNSREPTYSPFQSVQGHKGTLEAIGLSRVGQLKVSTKATHDTTWPVEWVSLQGPVGTVLATPDSPAAGRGCFEAEDSAWGHHKQAAAYIHINPQQDKLHNYGEAQRGP